MKFLGPSLVVGALIITIMFTAALTVPGGNKDTGLPTLLDDRAFKIFMISDAISLFVSIAAMMVTFSATVVIVMDRRWEFVVPMIPHAYV
ncbi:unnamed protein product [Linum trigynum]|uniref:PGG domain-containing protein n=1 Tax=Linum trigynum TaxID=586398 RepID=A0AAV2GKT4_9ROSI